MFDPGPAPEPQVSPGACLEPRVLIVEDCDRDAELMVRELARNGFRPVVRQVCSRAALQEALREGEWDVVISDYAMPQFTGLDALSCLKESGVDIPFILVSGTVGEDLAVEALKAGANDYLLKDRLARLGVAVRRELREAEERRRRARAESALRLQTSALNAAANAIVILNRAGRIEWVNPAFCRLSGYGAEEVLGRDPEALSGVTEAEPGFPSGAMDEALSAGGVWRGERVRRRRDGTRYVEDVTITPVLDEKGEVGHFVAIIEDVTMKRELEAQFLQAQRLEGIGALASGVAHDMNNILAPIQLIAPMLREMVEDRDAHAMLETVESCARRGASMVRQLLTFARGAPGARVPLPLQHLVREIGKIMRETFPREIATRVEASPDLWLVRGDPTQIHQALMNLCINARDAMPDGGSLRVEARNETLDEEQASRILDGRAGCHVRVSVTDTGTGIAPEHLDRLFLPFFTTKPVGKGTGLGLATVRGIVRGHDGFLRLETELGRGTQIHLYLPAAPELEAVAEGEGAHAALPDGGGRLILVVDDEDSVRAALCRALRRVGYRTLEAANGADGVAAYADYRGMVDAVVTDLMMPVMSGSKMVAALRGLDPGVIVIGMTGLMEATTEEAAVRQGGHLAGMVSKPFAAQDLLNVLSCALAGQPRRSPPAGGAGLG